MAERDRDRRREKEQSRDLRDPRDHRDRDRDRDRERDRTRGRDHRNRSRSPDHRRHTGSHTRSPDRRLDSQSRSRSRSHSVEKSHRRRHHHHQRSPSPDSHRRKRHKAEDGGDERDCRLAAVSEFVEGIAKEQKKHRVSSDAPGNGDTAVPTDVDPNEIEMMKKMGIPVGFDSSKGKPVPGANVSGVRPVTKRQPRQYMNRRGGFNRPLPLERNR